MNHLSTYLFKLFLISIVYLFSIGVKAVSSTITMQSKIIKPNGVALEANSVNFRYTTLDGLGACVLYVEQFSSVDMTNSGGLTVHDLGSGTQVYSATGGAFTTIFNNTSASYPCQSGGTFVPGSTDRRKIVIQFNDNSGTGWQTLQGINVNSVPYANVAGDSEKLATHPLADFTLKTAFPDCNTAGKVLTFNGTSFTCVSPSAGSGTVTNVTSANSYIGVATGTTTPVITANVGTAANTLAAGNDTRITGAAQKASNLGDLASASTARTNLGSTTVGDALFTAGSAAAARTTLGSTTVGDAMYTAGSAAAARTTLGSTTTGDALFVAASATAARTTLGLGTAAVLDAGAAANNLVQLDGTAKIPTALLPTSATFWQDAGSGKINYNGGNVGIGTASPFGLIHADGADINSQIFVSNTDSTTAHNPGFVVYNFDGAGVGGYPKLSMRNGRGSIGAQVATQAGDIIAALEFQGNRSGSWTTPATIQAIATETQTNAARGGAISFMTTKNGTSVLSEKVRIDSNGNVGFGNSSPTANIHLKAGTATAGTAPLKLTTGVNLTTPEAGAIEYDGTNLYYTDSTPTRKTIATTSGGSFTGVSSIANSGGNITLAPNATTGSVNVTSTTASTSSSTGALVVSGGVGASGDIYSGASINAGTTVNAATSVVTPQIYGSSSASGNIKIDGTSNATKGYVLLNSAGGNVGIGTSTPGSLLDVNGTAKVTNLLTGIGGGTGVNLGGAGQTVYSPSVNNVAISTNGTDRLRVDANGYVGVGTASPTGALHVVGGTAAAATDGTNITLAAQNAGTGNQSGGNIILTPGTNSGTGSAGGVYVGSAATPSYKFRVSSSNQSTLAGFEYAANDTLGPQMILSKYRGGSNSLVNADNLGYLDFSGRDAAGTLNTGARIQSQVDGTPANGQTPAALIFHTAQNGTGTLTERMRITNAGYVGIGATAPVYRFQVDDTQTNPTSTLAAVRGRALTTLSANNAYSISGVYGSSNPLTGASVTSTGTFNGVTGDASVVSGTNAGIVSQAVGVSASYGIQPTGAGTVTSAYGFLTNPYHSAGTITNSFGIYLSVPTTGATVTNEYGMYQASTTARNYFAGKIGIGVNPPTASLQIKAGTATAGTSPLKLTAGTNLTTPEAGAIEFDGTNLFYTDSTPTRRTIATSGGTGNAYTGVSSIGNSGGNISLDPNSTTGSVLVSSSTASVGAASGALVVTGGVGVGGAINATGAISSSSTVSASTSMYTPQLYGSASASGNILIDGSSNATKGNVLLATAGGKVGVGISSPTTTGIFQVSTTNASGSEMALFNPTNTSGTSAQTVINAYNTYSPSAAPTSGVPQTAISGTVTTGSANANSFTTLNGSNVGAYYFNASGTIGVMNGSVGTATNQSSGTVTTARGFYDAVSNISTGTITTAYGVDSVIQNTSTGTIVNSSALRAGAVNNSGGGTITNNYGLYVAKQNGTGITNAYGIFQSDSGDKNYFAGNVGIGTSSPAGTLDVTSTLVSSTSNDNTIYAHSSYSPGSAPASNVYPSAVSGTLSTSSTNVNSNVLMTGVTGSIYFSSASGTTLATAHGVSSAVVNQGTGTINVARSSQNGIKNTSTGAISTAFAIDSSISNTSTGSIGSGSVLRIGAVDNSGGGTIGTIYGINIAKQNGTGISTSYGIYQSDSGDKNYFAGNVGIGTAPTTSAALTVNGTIVSTLTDYPTGAAVDFSKGNTFTLDSVGGTAITISNQVHGGSYTVVVADTTARTYTFTGCTNTYFKPANAQTTVGTQSIYNLLTVKNGSNWNCYVTWATGYQ